MTHNLMISICNIQKSYQLNEKKQKVIDGLSLEIAPGDFITIRGPSGCGKSTLIHLMGGLDSVDAGDIVYQGKSYQDFSDADWQHHRRFHVAYVFQFFHLFPRLTIAENVLLPARIARVKESYSQSKTTELLTILGLVDKANDVAQNLSGGEMQRVALARALINQPQILFADEPTGNLDSTNALLVLELLSKLREKENLTVVLITHDDEVHQMGHKRLHMKDGKIVF